MRIRADSVMWDKTDCNFTAVNAGTGLVVADGWKRVLLSLNDRVADDGDRKDQCFAFAASSVYK